MLQGEREITLRLLTESTSRAKCAKWLMELRKGIEEGARIHAGLRAEGDRGVPVMDVKAVEGRSVG